MYNRFLLSLEGGGVDIKKIERGHWEGQVGVRNCGEKAGGDLTGKCLCGIVSFSALVTVSGRLLRTGWGRWGANT